MGNRIVNYLKSNRELDSTHNAPHNSYQDYVDVFTNADQQQLVNDMTEQSCSIHDSASMKSMLESLCRHLSL